MDKKKCPVCANVVVGRSDKLFCSAKCKSIKQYEDRQKHEKFYLEIDKQLKVNRKLLRQYNKSGVSTIRKSELLSKGFNPNYFTHFWKNKKGDVYLFAYEYGFLKVKHNEKEKYVLVKWQEYMRKDLK